MQDQKSALASFLAERDVPCPACNYNLKGLKSQVCPECNQSLVLRVGLSEANLKLWIGSIVGLSLGIGLHLVITIGGVIKSSTGGLRAGDRLTLMIAAMSLAAEVSVLLAILTWHRKVRRAGLPMRWAICVGCWLLMAASMCAIFLFAH